MGNARQRPRSVPLISLGDTVNRLGTAPIGDPNVDEAIKTIGRSLDAMTAPVQAAASHPTLRDYVVATRLRTGDNWISHGLGRKPRLVYVTLLDLPSSWVAWCWQQQTGDLDRARIAISVTSDAAAAAYSSAGGTLGLPPLVMGQVELAALVRLE